MSYDHHRVQQYSPWQSSFFSFRAVLLSDRGLCDLHGGRKVRKGLIFHHVCLFCARPAYRYYPISDYGMSYLDLILGLRRVHLMAGPGISSGCALFTHFAAFATYFRHTRGVLRTQVVVFSDRRSQYRHQVAFLFPLDLILAAAAGGLAGSVSNHQQLFSHIGSLKKRVPSSTAYRIAPPIPH